ncbi:hypothetical protein [Vibrio vulnificus]|uniref:hypothetical protein n=1 Tax=Vibrio vulnificus TaxID=672 RepID=UPI0009B5D884|nr:hypothetical protein [Vibrio vulnificus]OQK57767.1 putative membrane protein [Vibrio vulnificus]
MLLISVFLCVFSIFLCRAQHLIFWVSSLFVVVILWFGSLRVDETPYLFDLYVFLFLSLSLLYSFSSKELFDNVDLNFSSTKSYTKTGIFLGFVSIVFYVLGSGGVIGISRSWVDIAISRNVFELLMVNLSQLILLLSLSVLYYEYFSTKKSKLVIVIVVISILYLAITRVKAYLLPAIFPLLINYVLLNRANPFKLMLKGGAVALLVAFLYLVTTFFRWIGSIDKWSLEHFQDTAYLVLDKGIERNLFIQATSIYEHYLSSEYIYGQTYVYLLNPLLKLLDVSIENPMYVYSNLMYGESYIMKGSAHPSLFVDSFANFGAFGVFIGVVWLVFIDVILKILVRFGKIGIVAFMVTSAYSFPMILRGSVYYGFLYFLLSIFFVTFTFKLMNSRYKMGGGCV